MRTTVLFLLVSLALTGCGWFDRQVAQFTGHGKICIDGVTYLQFASGATPQYSIDGKLVACQ